MSRELAARTLRPLLRNNLPTARVELRPEAAATFFPTDRDLRIEFARDGSGKVTEAGV